MLLPKVIISPPLEDLSPSWCYFNARRHGYDVPELEETACVVSNERNPFDDDFWNNNVQVVSPTAQSSTVDDFRVQNQAIRESHLPAVRQATNPKIPKGTKSSLNIGRSGEGEITRRYVRHIVDKIKTLARVLPVDELKANKGQSCRSESTRPEPMLQRKDGQPCEVKHKLVPTRRTLAHQWRNHFDNFSGTSSIKSYVPAVEISGTEINRHNELVRNEKIVGSQRSHTLYTSATVPMLSSMHFDPLSFDSKTFSSIFCDNHN